MTGQPRERYSTTHLLREFDQAVKQVKPVLLKYYGSNTDTITQESRLEFERLIPRLPYIGGKHNPHTWNLVSSAWYLAFYKVLCRRGETPEAIAKVMYELYQQEGAENFTRYLCPLDAAMSEWMGLGLGRTQTLAEGAAYCDFRFKRGRETLVTTSKQPERHTQLVESLRRQRMAKNHSIVK